MNEKSQLPQKSKLPSGSVGFALFLAGAILSSPGWVVQRCSAGTGFPLAPADGTTFSIGVCQLVVDPSFAFLFTSATTYPGYSPSSGVLTSPVMYDFSTTIGESASYIRGTQSFSPPVVVGTPAGYMPATGYSNILGYSDYAVIPPAFSSALPGIDQMFTEMEDLLLQAYNSSAGQSNATCPDSRVPDVYPSTVFRVVAGPIEIPNLPLNRRSIGMVQQLASGASDFPAQSFFDMYVQVTLPPVPTTVSYTDFPINGAVLYNDAADPLLVINTNVLSVPPAATYEHDESTAVPVKFLTSNPPYWAADDVLGYLTLAGHGVFTNANPTISLPPPPCLAAQAGGLLDLILGPVGSPVASPPIPWLQTNDSFPTPGSSYNSFVDTFVDSGTTNVLDDTVSFALPGGNTSYVRDLVITYPTGSITPPLTAGSSATYSTSQMAFSFQYSTNGGGGGGGFVQKTASASGSLQLAITNTGTAGSTVTFATGILQLSNSVGGFFGTVYLRQSPTKQSLGAHTIASDPRGFRISSYFDAYLELSPDGVNWYAANKALRIQTGMPPAAPGSMFISQTGNHVILNWQNSFTLQSAPNATGPYTDVKGPITNGPFTNTIGTSQVFFRLRE